MNGKMKFVVAGVLALLCAGSSFAGSMMDSRDGKSYKTVRIGNQTWMAENLNYKINGSSCYDDEVSKCQTYGRLYTWKAAMKACPSGWHLPTMEEIADLVETAGSLQYAGKNLKSSNGWGYDEEVGRSGNGNDRYGFSALPAGIFLDYGEMSGYNLVGVTTFFWSSTEVQEDDSLAWYVMLSYDKDERLVMGDTKMLGLSVRCLKD